MDKYNILGLSLIVICLCFLAPYLLDSLRHTPRLTSSPLSDSLFVPLHDPSRLQSGRQRLTEAVLWLQRQKGAASSDWELESCRNRALELEEQLQSQSISSQSQLNELLKQQSKWKTTSRNWQQQKGTLQGQKDELVSRTVQDSLKIHTLDITIAQLAIDLGKAQTSCLPCSQCEDCESADCPILEPCNPVLPTCERCPACPPAQDCEEHLDNYATLSRKHEELEQKYRLSSLAMESCGKASAGEVGAAESCHLLGKGASHLLSEGMAQLTSIGKASSWDNQKDLQQLIGQGEEHLKGVHAPVETLEVVGWLVAGLGREVKRVREGSSRQGELLAECHKWYGAATHKLSECESKLQPYIRK